MGVVIKESSIISDDVETMERLKKEKEYYNYIKEHVKNVHAALDRYFIPLIGKSNICNTVSDEDLYKAIELTSDRIDNHDASKYLDAEFNVYRAKYYKTANEEKGDSDYIALVDDKFKEAWDHHYKNNPHHPEYWVDSETGAPIDMSLDAIIEMICDWEAVSYMFGTSILDWYEKQAKNDEQKAMTQRTRDIVEDLLYNVLHK